LVRVGGKVASGAEGGWTSLTVAYR